MTARALLQVTMIAQVAIMCALLLVLWRKKILTSFSFLSSFLFVWAYETSVNTLLLFFRSQLGFSRQFAYDIYFYNYWCSAVLEHVLLLCVIYQIFREAMTPFKGLSKIGTVVFKWALAVSMVVALGVVVAPGHVDTKRLFSVAGQFEQGVCILTICLLLFVCFSIRPLGITYRSHVFGVSLGLGILGTTSLVEAAWFAASGAQSLFSPIYLVSTLGGIVALLTWGTYFLMPEAKRKMVLLPTTSPYFHWNQISEALGDDPGVVAVSGFTPDALAPAERLVLSASGRTSVRAKLAQMAESATRVDLPSQEPISLAHR
jgi:hypothetical protein